MTSKMFAIFCTASFALTASAAKPATLDDVKAALKSQPYEMRSSDNEAVFAKYCVGDPNSAAIPQPNYSNALVKQAAQILTATKNNADQRLKENASATFVAGLDDFKTTLQSLISGDQATKNATIRKDAQTILDEVSKPDVTGLSDAANAAFSDINQSLLKPLADILPNLAKGLTADLKQLDTAKVKAASLATEKTMSAELKPVDYAGAVSAITALKSRLAPHVKQYDLQNIKTIAQNVISYLAKAQLDVDKSQAATDLATEMIGEVDANTPDALAQISYQVGSLQYDVGADNFEQTPELKKFAQALELESAKTENIDLLNSMQTTLDYLKAKDDTSLQYQMSTLVQTLGNVYAASPTLFGKTAKPTTQSLIAQVAAEAVKFPQQILLDQIRQMNASFQKGTAEGDQEALDLATGTVRYSLGSTVMPLSTAGKANVIALLSELNKADSSRFLTDVQALQAELAKTKGGVTDALSAAVSTVNSDLSGALAVSADTQALIKNFLSLGADYGSRDTISWTFTSAATAKSSSHFYFYGGVKKIYGLDNNIPAAAKSAGANREAHWFLTQLCGEFRDRSDMIEAKLNWIQNLYTLPAGDATVQEPETLAAAPNVWARVNASAYGPYIDFTRQLWEARRDAQERYITVGSHTDVDNPVPGFTVCETKYIFANYVSAGKAFDSVDAFNEGYKKFKGGCPVADQTDYYDFRGDSNFKHYSPESNGMIWYATSIAAACASPTELRPGAKNFTAADCENYFKNPFAYRFNAARAGLAAWLFRDNQYAQTFSNQQQMVAIYPHAEPQLAPFSFGFTEKTTDGALFAFDPNWLAIDGAWNSADIGYNAFTGLGTKSPNYDVAYERIRDAVDRHTDWYQSGYNDGNGAAKNQAYSPFVASSYEMSASDNFTTCGETVGCPDDGLKRWMFVFRVKAQNWYNPARVANNETVDFEHMWFDETSFGVSGLADGEKAWDRLGTPMESELDSILYLINVSGGGSGNGEEGE